MARRQRGVPNPAQWDPRKNYVYEHRHTMCLVRRELTQTFGIGVQQVLATMLTTLKFKNATRFADHDSMKGMAACVAFILGGLSGGKRARSFTSVKLQCTRTRSMLKVKRCWFVLYT